MRGNGAETEADGSANLFSYAPFNKNIYEHLYLLHTESKHCHYLETSISKVFSESQNFD